MLDICLAGTGGTVPLEHRWLACCFVEMQGKALLIDCGEGTQIALKKSKCKISKLSTVLITHFHADHVCGLAGLLLTLGNCGKTTGLTIVGALGVAKIVDSLLAVAPFLPYPIEIIELSQTQPDILKIGDVQISSLPLNHGIPCLGYSITVHRKPVFNPEKARALGVPKIYFRSLHEGNNVFINGKEIIPRMVLDKERMPLKMVYCTDSSPMGEMIDFAKLADLFVCEGMYGDDAMKEKMKEKGHMVFSQAAGIAKQADVKELWLTHFSPALQNPEAFLPVAQAVFPNTVVAYDGIRKSIK